MDTSEISPRLLDRRTGYHYRQSQYMKNVTTGGVRMENACRVLPVENAASVPRSCSVMKL